MLKKDTKRTSFDLSTENSQSLEKFSKLIGASYSKIVNSMLHIFLTLKPDMKAEFAEFCSKKMEEIKENMALMSEFEKQEAQQNLEHYQELRAFFLDGKEPEPKEKTGMRKVYLKEGYLLIPDSPDWILLDNFSTPSDCMYAGVVETREPMDGQKKYHAKHFVFFSDYPCAHDYPSDMDDAVFSACCDKDPTFKDILNAIVTPAYNGPEIVSNMTNFAEYKAAPCPGLFHIVEKGDPLYWSDLTPDYTPPYGAMIVR